MRFVPLILCAGLLAACDSGGTDTFTSQIQGVVYEVDGQTVDRAGVPIVLVETGDTVTTAADGTFTFDYVPEGTYTLGTGILVLPQTEDDLDGPPVVEITRSNGVVEIRLAIVDGEIVEFAMAHHMRARAAVRLEPAEGSTLGKEAEAKLRIDSRPGRERFAVTVEGLTEGDAVVLCMRDPEVAESLFVDEGSATADAEGEASIRFDTGRGDALPAGAGALDELAGYLVLVKVNDANAFEGTVPLLPEAPDGPAGGPPSFEDRARGMAKLDAQVEGVEGKVFISRWPAKDRQRFKASAEGLAEGDEVVFRMENPAGSGTLVDLATATADAEGEAKIDTKEGLPMPFGVADVEELVGRQVEVARGGVVILEGTVPELVAH